MKVKYKEGDIFVIPLSNGKYAICHIVFVPSKKFKQAIGFCILSLQNTEELMDSGALTPLIFEKFGKEMKVIFTGNQNISKGVWKIIGYADLTEEKKPCRAICYNWEKSGGGIPCPPVASAALTVPFFPFPRGACVPCAGKRPFRTYWSPSGPLTAGSPR